MSSVCQSPCSYISPHAPQPASSPIPPPSSSATNLPIPVIPPATLGLTRRLGLHFSLGLRDVVRLGLDVSLGLARDVGVGHRVDDGLVCRADGAC